MVELGAEPQYGFLGRLKAAFPSQVVVDSTEICNLACIHCPHPVFKKSEHYSGRHLPAELNEKLIDEVAGAGRGCTEYVRYSGSGEPLLHPRIFPMLEYAVAHSGVVVSLTTNGVLLDERRVEHLLATGISVVDISLDAFTPETYAAVRVKGDLTVTRANVLSLLRRAHETRRTKVVVSYIEQPQNRHETAAFEAYWKAEGADCVVVRRLHSGAGAVGGIADSLRQTLASAPRRPCLYPWERVLLNPRGELAFCPQDWVHGSIVADYRDTTVAEAWQGRFYENLRRAHLSGDYSSHAFCGQCPDWSATRWPHQGRSYADMIQDFKERA